MMWNWKTLTMKQTWRICCHGWLQYTVLPWQLMTQMMMHNISCPTSAPPVFIVGTHADKPVEDIEVIKKQIQERISGMEYEKHVVRPLFCIDNTQRPNLIKKFIQKFQKLRGKHKTGKIFDVILYPWQCVTCSNWWFYNWLLACLCINSWNT